MLGLAGSRERSNPDAPLEMMSSQLPPHVASAERLYALCVSGLSFSVVYLLDYVCRKAYVYSVIHLSAERDLMAMTCHEGAALLP